MLAATWLPACPLWTARVSAQISLRIEMNAGMFFQLFDEREIAREVGFLEDMLEIAARLMGMDQESEMETLGHGDSFFSP